MSEWDPPAWLTAALRDLTGGRGPGVEDPAALPGGPGAYLLLLALGRPLALAIRGLPPAILPPGWYIYAGSARGPGGIRARLARHLRSGKRAHWHIDHLSEAAVARRGFPAPAAGECTLLRALLARPGFRAPVPGFGSSDCRGCASHLLAVAQETAAAGNQRQPATAAR